MRHNLNNLPQTWYSSEAGRSGNGTQAYVIREHCFSLSLHCHGHGSLKGLCDVIRPELLYSSLVTLSGHGEVPSLLADHLFVLMQTVHICTQEAPAKSPSQSSPSPPAHAMNQIMTFRIPVMQDAPQAQMCTLHRAHCDSSPTGHQAEFREP